MSEIQTDNLEAARAQLARLLESGEFLNAHRDRGFLQFVSEETLAGRGAELKESVIAVRVFGRRSDFDPRLDSVVRVVANHVRKRLERYYLTEGAADPIRVEIPKGRYEPVFLEAAKPAPAVQAARVRRRWLTVAAVAAAILMLAGAGYLGFRSWGNRGTGSVAVVPFENLDGRAETGYLAGAISEDVITALARSPRLRVMGGLPSQTSREAAAGVQSLGRRLGAGTLLRGTVRRNGDQIKITAQLMDVAGGYHVWAESFEGPAAGVPEFQDRIARNVLRALGAGTRAAKPVAAVPTAAQEAYWQGRYLLRKGVAGRRASLPLLNEALRLAPDYAAAHAALATAYSTMAFHAEGDWKEMAAKAKVAARRALELDPDSAEACVALATLAYSRDRDWPAAEALFRRAIAASPNSVRAHTAYGLGLLSRGQIGPAVEHVRRAHELEPLSALSGNELVFALYCARRYRESMETAAKILNVRPDFAPAHLVRGMCLSELGEFAAARAEFEKAVAAAGRAAGILGPMGLNEGRAGDRAAAERLLTEIPGGSAVQSAMVAVGLGRRAQALELLERAVNDEETDAAFLAVVPVFAGLRGEPRFRSLLSRMGL